MLLYEEEGLFKDVKESEEKNYGFFEEEDAFFLLFEELFEAEVMNPKNVYEALRYLLWVRNIEPTYSKIEKLTPNHLVVGLDEG